MKRPNRENFENGVYGHIKYVNKLEKYCTHIEKENQALQLLQPDVIKSVCDDCKQHLTDEEIKTGHCFNCGEKDL